VTGDFAECAHWRYALAWGKLRVAVSFTPTATGARTGALTVVDDAGGSRTWSVDRHRPAAPASTGGTPSGSTTVTISAVAGTLSHVSAVTLTVQ